MIHLFCVAAFAIAGLFLLARRPGRKAVWVVLALANADAIVTILVSLYGTGERLPGVLVPWIALDASTHVFLCVVALCYAGICVYVESRLASAPELERGIGGWLGWSVLFVASAKAMILCSNPILAWALLEATTFTAIPLILFRRSEASVSAAWKYFVVSSVGLSLTLLGFTLIGRFEGGGLPIWLRAGSCFVVLGYGTKLGLAPLYSWLPDTYDAAPPATTALLASIQGTCATLALLRAIEHFDAMAVGVVRPELLAMGVASLFVGMINIIATHNFKKVLAYASISHAGVIALGLGTGKPAAYGLILYVVSNAFVKAVLFLTAGHIKSAFRTKDVRELAGLIRALPYSGLVLMLGTFALLGFAPFGSFWGELLIFDGLVEGRRFGVFAVTCAILTVTFVATGRSFFPMIWGESTRPPTGAIPSRASAYASFGFVAILLAIGIYIPGPVNAAFVDAATLFGGR